MAEQHRATSEQWALVRRMAHHAEYSTIFELRGRIEALEAAQPAESNHPAKPDSSLVERVANSLAQPGSRTWDEMAGDVIREVAAWLLKNHGGQTATTDLLEQEAEQ